MREKDRQKARELRKSGYSIKEIVKEIHCAKSSISGWIRDISLTPKQIERLKTNQDKGRAKAANHPNSPKQVWSTIRQDSISAAVKEIPPQYSIEILKIIGSALYWAEGYKSTVNMVSFSNSDPLMIALMMKFFREICNVPENKFRGAVNIHPHLNIDNAVRFWSKASGIPREQFHKTQAVVSSASKRKRDTLPVGTFKIIICDVRLQSRIKGWIQGLCKWTDIRAVGAIG
jgi:hypothetical protein